MLLRRIREIWKGDPRIRRRSVNLAGTALFASTPVGAQSTYPAHNDTLIEANADEPRPPASRGVVDPPLLFWRPSLYRPPSLSHSNNLDRRDNPTGAVFSFSSSALFVIDTHASNATRRNCSQPRRPIHNLSWGVDAFPNLETHHVPSSTRSSGC